MLNPHFDLPDERIQAWHVLAVPLLAIVILLSQASQPRPLSSWHVSWSGGPAEGRMGSDAAQVDPRELPAEVVALPELVDERTPHSATFGVADDEYRTVLSSRPLHYRDQRGDWQVINPLFQQTEENFIVTENNLRSRAGLRRAWLSTGVEDAAIYWQAEALYAGNRRLAEALPEAEAPAQALDGGYTLHYANSWSDRSLAEELLSRPGSIEHLLVLAEPPAWSGEGSPPATLDLEAELRLFPGASLWADGERLTDPATVDGALEIRNEQGEPVLRLQPVRAFEVNDPLVGVSGDYQLHPGEEDGAWQVRVRTPWSWWQAPERRYPAAIDPTMTVLKSTGSGTGGMAWVSNGNGESGGDYELGQVVLGSNNGSAHYAGYIQFNHMPATLQNALLQVENAELRMTAGYYHAPSYKHDGPDYKALAMQKSIQLSEVDLSTVCPNPAAGCFSLVDNRLNDPTFNWSNRPTALINSQTLPVKVGAPTGGGEGVPTSFNVTQTISDWYTLTPRPDHGPMFHVTTTGATCPLNVPAVPHTPPPYQIEDQPQLVPPCTRFRLWPEPESVQLLIDYTDVVMPPGANLLNDPGVPSYKDGIFDNTNHQYKLLPKDPSEPNRWRGVAVRGNHMLQQGLPARTNLGLLDFTDDAENPERLLENTGTAEADQTSFFFINDHACASSGVCEQGVDLRAEVMADEKNNFEDDQQRNYRLQYVRAEPYSAVPGKNPPLYDPFPSDELIHIYEFDALKWEDLTIFVTSTLTSTQALELMLLKPTGDGAVAETIVRQGQVNGASVKDQGNGVRVLRNTMLPRDGEYALAVINHQPPDTDPQHPQRMLQYPLTIQVIRCPYGTVYAKRLDDCQPIKIPTAGTPRRTISALDNLIVYSEGGFDEEPDGTWCTTGEIAGTPLIGPAVDGRYASVANGHVCWDGSALTTTPESGVGVAAEQNLLAGYGAIGPDFMYGDSTLWPVPPNVPTGVVGTDDGSSLLPTPSTRVNIRPLAKNWGNVTANVTDQIDLTLMKVTSDATVNAQVTTDVNADPTPVTWQVEWELYTLPTASYSYVAQSTQTPALHGQGGFVDLASLEVHIGTGGNPGRLETVDSITDGGMPMVMQFHAPNVRGAQSAEMGAAMQQLEAVVRPPGEPYLKGGTSKSCDHPISGAPTSCLDIRDPGYTWQSNGSADNVIAAWKLPDITIQDNMGSVAMSGPNGVMLFSKDHPLASTSPNFDQSFSFDSFGASVSVVQAKCFEEDEDTEIVTVIKGEAQMGLPSVGETGVPPYVKVGFQLCKDSLTFVALELGLPEPGIPVGSTGVGVSLIGGTVTIAPDHVVITIEIDFQTMDQSMVTNGMGEVTINTAGLFSLEAEADIVEFFHAELYLHVAWAPLDVLLKAGVDCCGGIIGGELYTHLWMGQGWQNKYSWLPDDEAIHFTGYVEAGLFIPEGYVTDIPPLPPFNFEISLKISFGEFCESPSSCSDPRWGMSTTLTIAGVSMGAYVDGDGMDFFFGTDNHVLIDQFGSGNAPLQTTAPLAPGPIVTPGQTQYNQWPPPHSSMDDWAVQSPGEACTETGNSISCPFDVTGSGRAGFSFSWQNGAPTPALIAPDNTPITPNNAASYGVTMTNTTTSNTQGVLYNVRPVSGQSLSGIWTMELSNIDAGLPPGTHNNYRLAAFSDPPAPEVQWVTPVISGTTPTGNSLTVQWNATRDGAPLSSGVWGELVYTPVYSKPTEAGVFLGIPIAGELQGNAGSYNWDVTSVPSGEYAVGLRLDDREQANGHVVSWAPGTVVISDTTPPPAPTIISINPAPGMADNLVVSWERPDAADLAGYLIEYDYPNWRDESLLRTVRRVPRGPESIFFDGKQLWFEGTEVARLTGLAPNYTTEICVRAYDFSENVGPCNTHTFTLPRAPEPVLGPPQEFTVNNGVGGIFDLNWMPPATGGPAAGYLVGYGPAGCLLPEVDAVAEEGQTPLDAGNVLNYQLSGLTPGQRYTLGVAAYTGNSFVGETAYTSGVYGDLGDYDADGLPDVWADAYDISDAGDDPDEDGLTSGEEWQLGSNPIHADSDGDGFYDGEEEAWNTDPCDASLEPPYKLGPKLVVYGPSVAHFIVASNEDGSATQTIDLFNLGAGEMAWTATTMASWLQLEMLPEDRLAMTAVPNGLEPSVYEGEVTIQTLPTLLQTPNAEREVTLQESVTVTVRLRVLPKQVSRVLLPVIGR